MAESFHRAKDPYVWSEKLFTIIGVWPLKSTYVMFTVWFVYLLIHLTMEFRDFVDVFGNLELMISNLSETGLEVMAAIKMLVIRFSGRLKRLMIQIIDGINEDFFNDDEEKRIYLYYNEIAIMVFKIWSGLAGCAATMYYLKPLDARLRAVLQNKSIPYVLPYRTRVFFFDVNEPSVFYAIWLYQFPMIYVHAFYVITVAYLFILILHICGQLAVLAYRIKNLDVVSLDNPRVCKMMFRDIFERHNEAVGVARDVNDLFSLILLEEFFITTLLLCLTTYSFLANSDLENKTMFLTFFIYGSTALVVIYGYCIVGEYLITESTNVCQAYYQCKWYDSSSTFKKQMMICMAGASKPLQLTGGGFYVFSAAGFGSVLKTALGYISMLRTVI